MKISTIIRHLREGLKNVVRNGWMTFASTSAIAISLFVLGIFLLLAINVNNIANQVESQVEIKVYLEVNTAEAQINSLQNEIGSIPEVAKVTFVSKAEGLEFLKEKLGEDGKELLEGFENENNPLPDAFTVEVNEPKNVAVVAKQIEDLNLGKNPEPIFKVYYGQGTVETLFKVTNYVRNIGLVLVIGLAFTAMFLIANTIKITIIARRKEISIMKLVGATNNFIRWPFFIEGAILGIIGSLIPIVFLLVGYYQLVLKFKLEMGLLLIQLAPVGEIGMKVGGLLLAIGVVIGIWGSTISIRKYLKV
jgi:cell division transport system permease protein